MDDMRVPMFTTFRLGRRGSMASEIKCRCVYIVVWFWSSLSLGSNIVKWRIGGTYIPTQPNTAARFRIK